MHSSVWLGRAWSAALGASEETGLAVVTEVMAVEQVQLVERYADVLQVGARNMQNFNLLNAVGEQSKPVLLKRGLSATLEEFLLAAEYILARGNKNVMLCCCGYPHLRRIRPQHAGPCRGSRAAAGEPSAGDRRSESGDRQELPGQHQVTRRGGGGRRWPDHRSPQRP